MAQSDKAGLRLTPDPQLEVISGPLTAAVSALSVRWSGPKPGLEEI